MNKLKYNEKHWRNMDEDKLEIFVLEIFNHYRTEGFPYYSTDSKHRELDFNKLLNYDRSEMFKDDIIKQTMHGLGLAWSYFPHSFDVRCGNFMTSLEAFNDDIIFKNVIRKRLKMGTYISDSGIRKMLKIYTGVQAVSNFRPTAAAAIYDRFADGGCVWDMSAGWGGRLLGAIISNVREYIGTEPSTKTHNGLVDLSNDIQSHCKRSLYLLGSEEFKPEKNSLNLCFTSPPYFDQEKYSNEETQSYVKYPTKKDWIDGYLSQTFENCYHGLKQGKFLLINIADIKGRKGFTLEKETIETAEKIGFVYIKTLHLTLSNVNLKNKVDKYKLEPIFVFIKK